jgi:hypothetical protein
LFKDREYPAALPPQGSPEQYPGTNSASENSFKLQNPVLEKSKPLDELSKPSPSKLFP